MFSLIQQLRNHLDLVAFDRLITELSHEGYELWVYEQEDAILGAMGGRVYTDFVRGSHLYIDDLVVDEKHRSHLIGAKLLSFAEQECRTRNLGSLRLACAISNEGGMRFYEREKWLKRSYNYVKKL